MGALYESSVIVAGIGGNSRLNHFVRTVRASIIDLDTGMKMAYEIASAGTHATQPMEMLRQLFDH
jgi:hypothetical protein